MASARRWIMAALTAMVISAAGPIAVAAATWTLTISPSSATVGVPATFTLAATNASEQSGIRCVVVDVPASFSVSGASFVDSTAGGAWSVARSGNRVEVSVSSGGGLDVGERVRFTVSAVATQGGSPGWGATAYTSQNCNGTALAGDSPVVVVGGAPSTPVPTPQPTPAPTPHVPPQATPRPSSGIVSPVVPVSASPTPEPRGAGSRPGETGLASASATASPTASAAVAEDGGSPGSSAPAPGLPGEIRVRVPSAQVPFQLAGASGGIDFAGLAMTLRGGSFAVPVAAIAGPGLLLLLWLGLQAIGAAAWLPAVRRLRGDARRTSGRRPT